MQHNRGRSDPRTDNSDEFGEQIRMSSISDELAAKDRRVIIEKISKLSAADQIGSVIRVILKDGTVIDGRVKFNQEHLGIFFLDKHGVARGSANLADVASVKDDLPQPKRLPMIQVGEPRSTVVYPELSNEEKLDFLLAADQELTRYHTEQRRKGSPQDPRWLIEFVLKDGRTLVGRAGIGRNPRNDLTSGKPFLVFDESLEEPVRVRLPDIKSLRKVDDPGRNNGENGHAKH